MSFNDVICESRDVPSINDWEATEGIRYSVLFFLFADYRKSALRDPSVLLTQECSHQKKKKKKVKQDRV